MQQGVMNAKRVLKALGRIGYEPDSAILDIVDNSVSAHAKNVSILLNLKESNGGVGAVLSSIMIIDDGIGMDKDGIDNALTLGSSAELYEDGTLSKFGMGLKSASSSLGECLSIISRQKNGKACKAMLDQSKLDDVYEYEFLDPTNDEKEAFDKHCNGENNSGTMIVISKLHLESLPKHTLIEDALTKKIGVVFYYYIKGEGVDKINIMLGGSPLLSVDPLFVADVDKTEPGLLEQSWDGLSVKMISNKRRIQISPSVSCEIEITQLPHPPTVASLTDKSQKQARDMYMIGAGHYGIYVYRNKRLISWADSLSMVGMDQDLYSFRGRLLIDSNADDLLNIDVTKSRIHLSALARDQLLPVIQEAKKKSKAAWNKAKVDIESKVMDTPHQTMNDELYEAGKLLSKDHKADIEASTPEKQQELQKKDELIGASSKVTPEEHEKVKKEGHVVLYVDFLANNQLWERALDPELGLVVRVNKSHRFYSDLVSTNKENSMLIMVLDVLFYGLAYGEYKSLYAGQDDKELKEIEAILTDFRERVGGQLSEIVKTINLEKILNSD